MQGSNSVGNEQPSGAKTDSVSRLDAAQWYEWEKNEWMTTPGSNCDALIPLNSGIIKTLPTSEVSVFPQPLPPLPADVRDKNEIYLEISSGLSENKWILIAGSIMLGPLPIGAPLFVLWLILFGPDDSVSIAIKLSALVITLLLLAIALPIYSIAFLSPEDEPIRFCRRNGKVYRYYTNRSNWLGMHLYHWTQPQVKEYEWKNCRAEIVRKIIGSTSSASYVCFLEIAVLDPATREVIERFRVGDRDMYSDFSTRVFLWETIRRYMEEGVDTVPPPSFKTHRGNLLDCIDDFNPLSIPAKSAPGAQRFFGYVLATIWWIVSVFALLAAFSRWFGMKISRAVNWGELEKSVFEIDQNDPALKRSLQPEIVIPLQWEEELRRRKIMASAWLITVGFQLASLWWFVIGSTRY